MKRPKNKLVYSKAAAVVKRVQPLWVLEKNAIKATMKELGGHVELAASLLQIGKTTVYRKLKLYGLWRLKATKRRRQLRTSLKLKTGRKG